MKPIKSILEAIKKIYIISSGYAYNNLGRLFLRLFIGIMLLQFGVRQIIDLSHGMEFIGSMAWMDSYSAMITIIIIELVCSVFIMIGFLTRLMSFSLFIAFLMMVVSGMKDIMAAVGPDMWQRPEYLPIMFLGILFFLLLSGPGKISVDYFLSLHIIHTENKSEDELEEV